MSSDGDDVDLMAPSSSRSLYATAPSLDAQLEHLLDFIVSDNLHHDNKATLANSTITLLLSKVDVSYELNMNKKRSKVSVIVSL